MKNFYILFVLLLLALGTYAQKQMVYCGLLEEYNNNELERVIKTETVFMIDNQSVRILPKNSEHSELVRINKSKLQVINGSSAEEFKTINPVSDRMYDFVLIKDTGHLSIKNDKMEYAFSRCQFLQIKD